MIIMEFFKRLISDNIIILSDTTLRSKSAKKSYDKIVAMYETVNRKTLPIIMNEFEKLHRLGYAIKL